MIGAARIASLGDSALTVTFADRLDPGAQQEVVALTHDLARRPLAGQVELVPAYVALTIRYDPFETDYASIKGDLARRLEEPRSPAAAISGRRIEIPTHYDGPDLAEVAEKTRLDPADVIRIHSEKSYQVALLGFVPGWAYLGELDPRLVIPRRATPRARVPPGSVAIAGSQTGIYPAATPGGWHLIGRTTVRLFDPTAASPALLAVGDLVQFVAVE